MSRSGAETERRVPRGVSVGVDVLFAGVLIDLLWHFTHHGFETASDQLRAHSVIWVGGVILVVATTHAVVTGDRRPGIRLELAGSVLYVLASGWHFYLHSEHRDAT